MIAKISRLISSPKGFNLWYFFVVALDILAIYKYPGLTMIVKPLIIASLMGLYISKSKYQNPSVLIALIFALFGDVFLLFQGDTFFQLGLTAFLMMQLLYANLFYKHKLPFNNKKLVQALFVISLAALFLLFGYSKLGNYLIPVLLYIVAIIFMVITAILRNSKFDLAPILVGAFFFMASDFLLAWDKFITSLPVSGALIMSTYAIAQLLIVNGFIYDNVDEIKS